jgi:hypothetical protein
MTEINTSVAWEPQKGLFFGRVYASKRLSKTRPTSPAPPESVANSEVPIGLVSPREGEPWLGIGDVPEANVSSGDRRVGVKPFLEERRSYA